MRSRVRFVQGSTTVASSQDAVVANVAAVRCPCSSTSSLNSSGVGGGGFAGRNSSPLVSSQVRQDPGVTSACDAAVTLVIGENAAAVVAANADPSSARRV